MIKGFTVTNGETKYGYDFWKVKEFAYQEGQIHLIGVLYSDGTPATLWVDSPPLEPQKGRVITQTFNMLLNCNREKFIPNLLKGLLTFSAEQAMQFNDLLAQINRSHTEKETKETELDMD